MVSLFESLLVSGVQTHSLGASLRQEPQIQARVVRRDQDNILSEGPGPSMLSSLQGECGSF